MSAILQIGLLLLAIGVVGVVVLAVLKNVPRHKKGHFRTSKSGQ